jgi:hypothetical protein
VERTVRIDRASARAVSKTDQAIKKAPAASSGLDRGFWFNRTAGTQYIPGPVMMPGSAY